MFSPRAREMSVRMAGHHYASWGVPSEEGKDLRSASRYGNVDTVLRLIEAARQPISSISLFELMEERDNIGCTALCIAALNGREAATRVLLSAGANQNVESESGLTPLDVCLMKGHEKTAQLFRDSGARRSLSSESSAYVRARLGPRSGQAHESSSNREASVEESQAVAEHPRPHHEIPKICHVLSSQTKTPMRAPPSPAAAVLSSRDPRQDEPAGGRSRSSPDRLKMKQHARQETRSKTRPHSQGCVDTGLTKACRVRMISA